MDKLSGMSDKIGRIVGSSTKIIQQIADQHGNEPVEQIEARLRSAINSESVFGASEYVSVIASRIASGVRGEQLFD